MRLSRQAPKLGLLRGGRMSDINLKFEWWELLLFSPVVGWPGLILGAGAGALAWRGHRTVGAALGAIVGNLAWAFATIYLK